jgi:hypothetical protein
MSDKLYDEEVPITVKPFNGFINKWKAEARIETPYKDWGGYSFYTAYAKTAEDALEKIKDKLCKITAREERKHAEHLEWKSGIKDTTFSRERDCNPVVPRPKPF